MTPHPLTNFEIQAYYQNEPRFNGVYSRDNLPDKIKDGVYVVNINEYSDIGTYWVALYVNNKTVTYFHSSGIEHISKEVKKFVNNKNIIANIFKIQAYDLVMCGYLIISASLSLAFSLCTGLVKKLLKATRNKKKKHNKIAMLARIKLDSIESKISEPLISNQISHEDFITIIHEERNYRELKESIE